MRDGVTLATDVYLPSTSDGPWPVLLIRTPYGREDDTSLISYTNDYALVIQDVRGQFDSEGEYRPFHDDGWGELQDGYDTVMWINNQEWCDGKIGTYGGSALGITQHLLAGIAPPGVACQFILVGSDNLYPQLYFQGGVLRLHMLTTWLGDRGAIDWLDTIKEHPNYDAFWDAVNTETRIEMINLPAYHIGGWYDIALKGTINGFLTRQTEGDEGARGNQKLLIGPWTHNGIFARNQGEVSYPPNAAPDEEVLLSRWIDHWLKGEDTGIMDEPPVHYYVMGDLLDPEAPGNAWQEATTWPPYDLPPQPYYMHQGGMLLPHLPEEENTDSSYLFDPEDPVPTRGGANLFLDAGPYIQTMQTPPVEERDDVILFSTPPLEEPLEVTGNVKVILYASSNAVDTDFTAKLSDVYPATDEDPYERSLLVADGIIRARYRNSLTTPELLTPGTIYRLEVDLWATSIIFNKGHRIRLALSSSNYPRFDVNANTGGEFYEKEEVETATNTIHYNKNYPSHILLPLIP
jgi:putative CocE/NonD family hydrolase